MNFVEIVAALTTKNLLRSLLLVQMERTKLLIAEQRRRVMEKEQETAKMIATISAQKDAHE